MDHFKKAIIDNNISDLKSIYKVDIHNHAITSCTKEYLINHGIQLSNDKIDDIQSLINFSRSNLKSLQLEEKGLRLLLEGNFENCIETGVKIVGTSIDYKVCIRTFNYDVDRFIEFLKSFKYKNLEIFWDLSISRDSYLEEYKKIIIKLLKTKFFYGIDLVSTENIIPNLKFKDFYDLANSLNMMTKVHTGEQLGPIIYMIA